MHDQFGSPFAWLLEFLPVWQRLPPGYTAVWTKPQTVRHVLNAPAFSLSALLIDACMTYRTGLLEV